MTPEIDSSTAIAMCRDDYLGMEAIDDPAWQGAAPDARSCFWEGPKGVWCFCFSPARGVVYAQHEDGTGAVSFLVGARTSEWEVL